MNNLQLISDYKHNAGYRLSFNQLAKDVFGIDFEKWYQLGLWTDRYICYSYIDEDKVVANASINKVEVVLEGKKMSALQIGTVMTHPDYRKRGLAANLLKTILADYEDKVDVFYLFPDDDAIDFYLKFDFASFMDGRFTLEFTDSQNNAGSYRKLNISETEDLNILVKMAEERISLSKKFGIDKAQHVLTWYCVNFFSDFIYYQKEEDVIIICKQDNDVLSIFDVVSRKRVSFETIIKTIDLQNVSKVVFHFTPDFSDIDNSSLSFKENELIFFKPTNLAITGKYAHPLTAHA